MSEDCFPEEVTELRAEGQSELPGKGRNSLCEGPRQQRPVCLLWESGGLRCLTDLRCGPSRCKSLQVTLRRVFCVRVVVYRGGTVDGS